MSRFAVYIASRLSAVTLAIKRSKDYCSI